MASAFAAVPEPEQLEMHRLWIFPNFILVLWMSVALLSGSVLRMQKRLFVSCCFAFFAVANFAVCLAHP